MLKVLISSLVSGIILTATLQYLHAVLIFEASLSAKHQCQQDKLLIRQMLILDFQYSLNKQCSRVPFGFKIASSAYILYPSNLAQWELYKYASTNPRPSQHEIISRAVKELSFAKNMVQIYFKSVHCTPLVIHCVFENPGA